jgi:selenide, water dikinase
VLTKPIGTGILTTARRRDAIGASELGPAIASMETLNKAASEAMIEIGVSAATDVTGFGLLGHLREMTTSSKCGAVIDASAVPLFDRVLELASAGHAPGGTRANLRQAMEAGVAFAESIGEAHRLALCDAQTSGGLLISVPEARSRQLMHALARAGVNRAAVVGRMCVEPGLSVE